MGRGQRHEVRKHGTSSAPRHPSRPCLRDLLLLLDHSRVGVLLPASAVNTWEIDVQVPHRHTTSIFLLPNVNFIIAFGSPVAFRVEPRCQAPPAHQAGAQDLGCFGCQLPCMLLIPPWLGKAAADAAPTPPYQPGARPDVGVGSRDLKEAEENHSPRASLQGSEWRGRGRGFGFHSPSKQRAGNVRV